MAFIAVALGAIATPEQDYWETSAEHPQGKRCDGLKGAQDVQREQHGRNSAGAGSAAPGALSLALLGAVRPGVNLSQL